MRTGLSLAVAVASVALTLCASVSGEELTLPADWGGAPGAFVIDTETKLSGKSSCVLGYKNEKRPSAPLTQWFDAAAFAGKRVKFSGYVKSQDVAGNCGLWMRVDSVEHGSVAFDNMQDRRITGTTDWYKYELVLDVPDPSDVITFGAFIEGNKGKMWVDDFAIEIVGNDVEVTASSIPATDQKITKHEDLRKRPANLSFESTVKWERPPQP